MTWPVGTERTVGGFDHNDTSFFNRELSWLAFNARVLDLSCDPSHPLLERVRFLSIFASNLDEFFQVRVAGLKDQQAAGYDVPTPDGRTPDEQLAEIRRALEDVLDQSERIFLEDLVPQLADHDIRLVEWHHLDSADRSAMTELFEEQIYPILTPLAVDPGHPFPYISDLSLNLAVVIRDQQNDRQLFARIKVPPALPRFIALDDEISYVPVEQVIAAHLPEMFPGMEVLEHHTFRVTRNADLTLEEEEADDLLSAVEMELRRRRFGRAIRLEVLSTMSSEVRELLIRELDVDPKDVYESDALVDIADLAELADLPRPDLKYSGWSGITEPELVDEDGAKNIFEVVRSTDVLLHHPYSSFGTSVVEFLHQAASDPTVLAIKMTLYRTSGDSPIIKSLIRAAEDGKQVAVLVELKARFDEEANIGWARRLEQAGVHVTYGLVGLKTHAKCAMVVRQDADGIRRYCHIGTGNYNNKTARIYEDLGLLTSDDRVGNDLAKLFNQLTGYGRGNDYERLLVAPEFLRPALTELIQREHRASNGWIVMKMNSLVDRETIELLYEASQAGVKIDLIVRGICCLRPGVPGISDNIRVRSIVGRYLEHSRVYVFGNGSGPGEPSYYFGSADMMFRNLSRRVEALVQLSDPQSAARLKDLLDVNLADDQLAWELEADGSWTRRIGPAGLNTHTELQARATEREPRLR